MVKPFTSADIVVNQVTSAPCSTWPSRADPATGWHPVELHPAWPIALLIISIGQSNCYDIELAKFLLKAATKLDRIVVDPCKRFYKGDGEYGLIGIRILLSVNCAEKCSLDCSKMNEPKDWISELPQCILVDIVNLVDTKDAAKTSTLSEKWKYLWTMRPDLKFDHHNLFGSNHEIRKFRIEQYHFDFVPYRSEFVKRVNHIMQQRCEGTRMHSLNVTCFIETEHDSVDQWISSAINAGVEKLELLLGFRPHFEQCFIFPENLHYNFPYWLFSGPSASSLKYLHLDTCLLRSPIAPGDFRGLSNLTTLKLESVVMEDDFIASVFSNCLLLEDLTLKTCDSFSKLLVVGSSLRLVHLKVIRCLKIVNFVISAPNLTTFEFSGNILLLSSLEAPSLEKMYIYVCGGSGIPHAFNLFTNLPRFENLYLTLPIDLRKVEGKPKSLGSFRNLKQLELFYGGDSELTWLLSILNALPLLQNLSLMFCIERIEEDQTMQRINVGGTTLDQLKHVKMGGCVGNWYEIEFAKFVLRAATKLEKLVITPVKRYYLGDGEEFDLSLVSSWPESDRARVHGSLKGEVPAGIQFIADFMFFGWLLEFVGGLLFFYVGCGVLAYALVYVST
ncbi:hypothetical protein TEA_012890 [Camellia sinensis var. sinensis]|uniref:Uncharacterized protein n=1 Tax=Camellia sinensis var. sinensis TaxID=542762 RepID=A0A4S4DQT0_CAMSN|nr:hypothetical protein TEA_012890 [Camellia sinensis var. sinensis]